MYLLKIICLIVVFVVCLDYTYGLFEGDSCTTKSGEGGICRFLTDCASALADIQRGKFPQDICGFVGTQSIVCCKGSGPPIVTPTPTPFTSKPTPTKSKPTKISNRGPGFKTLQKCKEYAKYAYDTEESPILSASVVYSNVLECPFEKEELIVGGTQASRYEFPHMAQIGYQSERTISWSCGGTLISENFVLTAAHCLESRDMGPAKFIRGGITNLTDLYHAQQRKVVEIIQHPNYVNKYHDIGLLRVEYNFELNIYLRPACLYVQKSIPYRKAIASGWGKIEFAGRGSKELLKVTLEFFNNQKCNTTYRRDIIQPDSPLAQGILDDIMLCAGSSTEYKDTCQGDSGGPLQVYHEETEDIKCMYDIVGVTAFGKSCGLAKNVPGVYTRVSAYVKWIEDIVWK